MKHQTTRGFTLGELRVLQAEYNRILFGGRLRRLPLRLAKPKALGRGVVGTLEYWPDRYAQSAVIYLSEKLTRDEQRATLVHELTHQAEVELWGTDPHLGDRHTTRFWKAMERAARVLYLPFYW